MFSFERIIGFVENIRARPDAYMKNRIGILGGFSFHEKAHSTHPAGKGCFFIIILLAELSELADERDLGSRVLWRVGSSPTFRMIKAYNSMGCKLFLYHSNSVKSLKMFT